jgi:hypothetical protein
MDAYTTDSVNYWTCEYDRGGRDPTDSSRAGRTLSEIVEAGSNVLSEQPFSSTRYIAGQLRRSRDLAKRTLVGVLEMNKFSLRCVSHQLRVAEKREGVADSRRLLQALRADSANEFVNIITTDES